MLVFVFAILWTFDILKEQVIRLREFIHEHQIFNTEFHFEQCEKEVASNTGGVDTVISFTESDMKQMQQSI